MTTLAVALAVTLVLLTIATLGNRNLVAANRRLRAELEDARNEVRWHQRRRHPAGRGLTDTPLYEETAVVALREALEDRDAGTEPGA
jgi:hypothetical protein